MVELQESEYIRDIDLPPKLGILYDYLCKNKDNVCSSSALIDCKNKGLNKKSMFALRDSIAEIRNAMEDQSKKDLAVYCVHWEGYLLTEKREKGTYFSLGQINIPNITTFLTDSEWNFLFDYHVKTKYMISRRFTDVETEFFIALCNLLNNHESLFISASDLLRSTLCGAEAYVYELVYRINNKLEGVSNLYIESNKSEHGYTVLRRPIF